MNADQSAPETSDQGGQETVAETPSDPKTPRPTKKSAGSQRILLVPYPKFVFMYPTLIVATLAAISLWWGGFGAVDPASDTLPVVMTALFLVVMMFNMFIIVFDFPRATSLTLIFVVSTASLGFWILLLAKPDILPSIQSLLTTVRPAANTSFFLCITVAMLLMYVAIFVKVKFDYWELRKNELLHHHGILSDLKRYPAPNLRVDKEINDVFEFMLLGAGTLILHPSTEKRAIVLDNILFVSKKERELTKMLGSIKVEIGGDSDVN